MVMEEPATSVNPRVPVMMDMIKKTADHFNILAPPFLLQRTTVVYVKVS